MTAPAVECEACGLHRPPTSAEAERADLAALVEHWRDTAKSTRERTSHSPTHAAYLKSGADTLEACADALAGRLAGQ